MRHAEYDMFPRRCALGECAAHTAVRTLTSRGGKPFLAMTMSVRALTVTPNAGTGQNFFVENLVIWGDFLSYFS